MRFWSEATPCLPVRKQACTAGSAGAPHALSRAAPRLGAAQRTPRGRAGSWSACPRGPDAVWPLRMHCRRDSSGTARRRVSFLGLGQGVQARHRGSAGRSHPTHRAPVAPAGQPPRGAAWPRRRPAQCGQPSGSRPAVWPGLLRSCRGPCPADSPSRQASEIPWTTQRVSRRTRQVPAPHVRASGWSTAEPASAQAHLVSEARGVASASARRSSMPRCSLTRRRAPPTALALAAAASASYCRVRASKSVSASPVVWPVRGSCLVVKHRQTSAHLAWHSTLVCPGSICKAAHEGEAATPPTFATSSCALPVPRAAAACGGSQSFLAGLCIAVVCVRRRCVSVFIWFCYWSPSMRILACRCR